MESEQVLGFICRRQTTWYRMLDTIREFGEDRLGASGEQAAIRMRFIARYLDKARYFAGHLTDADQLEKFREFNRLAISFLEGGNR